MKQPLPTLRLRFPAAGKVPPSLSRVLVRQRVGWAILAGMLLAVLLLPAHRALVGEQLMAVVFRRPTPWVVPWLDLEHSSGQALWQEQLGEEMRAPVDDSRLQLGAVPFPGASPRLLPPAEPRRYWDASFVSDVRLDYLKRLRRRFPNDPVVLATLLRHYAVNHLRVRRGDRPDGISRSRDANKQRVVLLVPEIVGQTERWVAMGERLEPGNGFFPSMLAAAYFGAGRDADGLRAFRRASLCPTWDDYGRAEGQARRQLLQERYGDRGFRMRVIPYLTEHYGGDLAWLEASARVVQWHARRASSAGDQAREHGLRADLLRMGLLMSHSGATATALTSGHFVLTLGVHAERTSYSLGHAGARALEAGYMARVRREAPDYVPLVAAAQGTVDSWRPISPVSQRWDLWRVLSAAATGREVLGLSLLANLLTCTVAAALLGLFAAVMIPLLRRWIPGWEFDLVRWFWHEAPWLLRAIALGFAPFLVLLLALLTVVLVTSGGGMALLALLFAVVLVLTRRRDAGELGWRPLHGLAVAMLAILIAALAGHAVWQEDGSAPSHGVVPGASEFEHQPIADPVRWILARLVPTGAALLGAVVLAAQFVALTRRASVRGALDAAVLGLSTMSAALAVVYVGYLLLAVPADRRDAGIAHRLIAVERRGDWGW